MLLVDHFDSFSANLYDWLAQSRDFSTRVRVVKSNQLSSLDCDLRMPIVLGPGSGSPRDQAELVRWCSHLIGSVPILGVCLGHQVLGEIAGLQTRKALKPAHGLPRKWQRSQSSTFLLRECGVGAVYNSLVLKGESLAEGWRVVAQFEDGDTAAIDYSRGGHWSALGLQFHPESFLTEESHLILEAWLGQCQAFANEEHFLKGLGYERSITSQVATGTFSDR